MSRTKRIEQQTVVLKMVESLLEAARREDVDMNALAKINTTNFNVLLDDLFNDGGETRCERFCDLGWEYSLQFGHLESAGCEAAQWSCVEAAINEIWRRLN